MEAEPALRRLRFLRLERRRLRLRPLARADPGGVADPVRLVELKPVNPPGQILQRIPRPARLQVRRVRCVHGETRSGCLAQGECGPRVIDVVVGEDDPIDPAQGLCLDEAKDRAEAAGISRIDDGETLAVLMQVRLRAANARNPADHILIIYGRWNPGWGTSTGAGGGSWISGCGGWGASSGPGGSPTFGWPGLGITGSGRPG